MNERETLIERILDKVATAPKEDRQALLDLANVLIENQERENVT
jgi:hypothetical protein